MLRTRRKEIRNKPFDVSGFQAGKQRTSENQKALAILAAFPGKRFRHLGSRYVPFKGRVLLGRVVRAWTRCGLSWTDPTIF